MSSQRGGKKGAAKPEPSGSVLAVDELRKRIAAEAEVIVQETMPRKVPPARPRAPPRRTPARPRTRRAHTHTAGGARAALRADRPCPRACVSVMIPRAKGSPSDGAAAAGRAQVAELTRILEEDELFQYPEKDDLIGPVRAPPASCAQRRACPAAALRGGALLGRVAPRSQCFHRRADEVWSARRARLEEEEARRGHVAKDQSGPC